jgi:hypothetical protein
MSAQETESTVTSKSFTAACNKLKGTSDYPQEICDKGFPANLGKVGGRSCEEFFANTHIKDDGRSKVEKTEDIGLNFDELKKKNGTHPLVAEYKKNCESSQNYLEVVITAQQRDLKTFGEKLGGYCSAQSGQQGNFKNMFEGLGGLGQQPNATGTRQ